MFYIVYEFEGTKVASRSFDNVFDCSNQLEKEGFDMSHPVNRNTVASGNTTATIMTVSDDDQKMRDALEAAEFALFEARNAARGIDHYEKEAGVLESLRVVVENMRKEL